MVLHMLFLIIMRNKSRFIRFFTSKKTMTSQNELILIKLVFNKDKKTVTRTCSQEKLDINHLKNKLLHKM